MILFMHKFSKKLDSRPAGREAWLAIQPKLREAQANEEIALDFEGVLLLTPSFADEFVTLLLNDYPNPVVLEHTKDNITVQKTLEFLSETWKKKPVMR
jgi:hypothetical protein